MTISPADQVRTLQAPALALFGTPAASGVMSQETEASLLAGAYGVDPSALTTPGDSSAVSSDQVLADWISGQSGAYAPAPTDPTSVLTAYYTMLDTSGDSSFWNNLAGSLTSSSSADGASPNVSTTA